MHLEPNTNTYSLKAGCTDREVQSQMGPDLVFHRGKGYFLIGSSFIPQGARYPKQFPSGPTILFTSLGRRRGLSQLAGGSLVLELELNGSQTFCTWSPAQSSLGNHSVCKDREGCGGMVCEKQKLVIVIEGETAIFVNAHRRTGRETNRRTDTCGHLLR